MKRNDEGVARHTPVSEPVFHMLLALTDEARHGYGVLVEVRRRTGGRVHLGIGTLYSAIKRLREQGLIREVDAPEGAPDDPRRRYYRLTEAGRGVVTAEARRLDAMVQQARAKAVLPAPDPTLSQEG